MHVDDRGTTVEEFLEPDEVVQEQSYAEGGVSRPRGYEYPEGLIWRPIIYEAFGDLFLTNHKLIWIQGRKGLDRLLGAVRGVILVPFEDIREVKFHESRWMRAQYMTLPLKDGREVNFQIREPSLWTWPRAIRWRHVKPRPSVNTRWADLLRGYVHAD
jgi:hypothetical protein